MVSEYLFLVWFGAFVMATLYGLLRATIANHARKLRDEQRELLKWQAELERRANEIREKSR